MSECCPSSEPEAMESGVPMMREDSLGRCWQKLMDTTTPSISSEVSPMGTPSQPLLDWEDNLGGS